MDPMQEFEKYINAYSRYNQGMLDPGDPTGGRREWKMVETYPGSGEYEKKHVLVELTAAEKKYVAVAGDALRLAAAIPFKISYEEFKFLYDQVAELQESYYSGDISESVYQEKLWEAAEDWEEQRAQQAHYTPLRTDDGQPVDWDASNPKGMQERLQGAFSSDPSLAPVIDSARKGELASALEAINAAKPSGNDGAEPINTDLGEMVGKSEEERRDWLRANGGKPSGNEAVESFAATKQAQQSVPSLNMDLGELASKSDKHLNDWLLNGKLLNVREAPPDALGSTDFGGHSLDSIQAAPVGQRDPEAVKAWIEAMRAHHAKMVADSQAQSVAALNKQSALQSAPEATVSTSKHQSVLQDVAGHADKRTSAPPVINTPEAVEALTNSEPAEEAPSGAASSSMNALHMGLDAIGLVGDAIVPGAGVVADGANALLYLARAASDPEHAGEHLKNALISGVSMVPFLGDAAKGFKYGANTGTAAGKTNAAAGIFGSLFGGMAGGHGGGGATAAAAGGHGGGGGGHGANLAAAAANAVGGMGGVGGGGAPPAQNPGGAGGGGQAGPQGMQSWMSTFANMTAIFGVASAGVYAVTKGFEKLNEWLNEVDQSSRKLIEQNRELAKYSGVTAAAYAQLDHDRLMRQVEMSKSMGGPMSRLNSSQSEYEQAMQDLSTPYKKLDTDVQAVKTEIATYLIKVIDKLDFIGDLIEWWYGSDKDSKLAQNAADALARDAATRFAQRRFNK